MAKKAFASAGILALLLGLTACDDDEGGTITPGDDNSAEEQTDENGADEEELAEEEEDAEEAADDADTDTVSERPTFGDTYTYDDGLSVTISQPEEFTPSETAFGGEEFDTHLQFEVTIENETGEDYNPDLSHISASSGGQEGDAVFDSSQGLDSPPSTTLLDGQSTSYSVGFGVNDAEDVTVEYSSIDFENLRDSVIFVTE